METYFSVLLKLNSSTAFVHINGVGSKGFLNIADWSVDGMGNIRDVK